MNLLRSDLNGSDPGGNYKKECEPPHLDVNYRRGKGPGGKKKRKLFKL